MRRAGALVAVTLAVAVVAAACSGPGTSSTRHTRAPAPVTTTTVPSVYAGSIPFGVYAGPGNPSGVASFARRTGTAPSLASDYLPRAAGWTAMTRLKQLRFLASWRGRGYRLVLAVPLIPTKDGQAQGTVAAGATGNYDARFTTLARTLVAYGLSNAVLRLGWAFNVTGSAWAVSDSSDAALFAAYFRNVVTTMRAVPGAHFAFVWNPAPGSTAYDLTLAYPGDAFVDFVGLDLYDQTGAASRDPQRAWAADLDGDNGLDWLASFSAAHHKPATLPEWGDTIGVGGHGLGDDPAFVAHVAQWAVAHDVAFTNYYAADLPEVAHNLLDGSFPRSLAEFRRLFATTTPVPLSTVAAHRAPAAP